MKALITVVFGLLMINCFGQPDSVVRIVADSQGLASVPRDQIPKFGTFWIVSGAQPLVPLPFLPPEYDRVSTPVYSLGSGGQFLVDATGGAVPQPTGRQALRGVNSSMFVEAQINALLGLIGQVQETQANPQFNPATPSDPRAFSYPTNAILIWQLTLNAGSFAEPAIAPDGTIYVYQNACVCLGSLWAINPDSSIKWQTNMYELGASTEGLNIGVDGTIYISGITNVHGNSAVVFCALNPTNGGIIWQYPAINSAAEYAPAIGPDGTVYLPEFTQILAITNGSLKWAYPTNGSGSFLDAFPVVGPDGTIYVNGYDNNNIYALNPDGSLKWVVNGFTVQQGSALAVGSDGTIYCLGTTSTNYAYLEALNANGTVKWQCTPPTNTSFYFTPEIGPDGTIYTEAENNAGRQGSPYTNLLCALTPGGILKWTFPLPQWWYNHNPLFHGSTCAIASDGEIYATTTDGSVYSLAPNGTINWSTNMGVTGLKAPIIGPDGTVYVVSYDYNYLFAFYGPAPVACGQWPQCRGNSRNTAAFAPAYLSSPFMRTNGFQFNITGTSNMPVCSCASSDLVNWTNIGQIVLTNGTASFVDTQSSNFPNRFYRALPQ